MAHAGSDRARWAQPLPAAVLTVSPALERRVLSLDASGLLQAMDEGALSSEQVTSVYIRRARVLGRRCVV